MKHVRIHITGIVQGVGMRPFVYREAVAHGISGWVLNAGDGVHIEACAAEGALAVFVRSLRDHAPAASRIDHIAVEELDAHDDTVVQASTTSGGASARRKHPEAHESCDMPTFRIIASRDATAHTTLVSPDIATCDDCLRELFNPADRRYHYPFINCTNCGPRFTIIRDLPYDRVKTSMSAFPMCPNCADEYSSPLDRRFHAQPDACFVCGPHITWREREDHETAMGDSLEASDAIIARCAEVLAADGIVAIKGLGGFHLACRADSEQAVRELRRRKRRSNKPLAVMVRNVQIAQKLCRINQVERDLLTGSVRPIVLLMRHAEETCPTKEDKVLLAPAVAFDLPELGVMLPYTPLQHLLMEECRTRGVDVLVMTSGNISEEPIEKDDEHAWDRLVASEIADALLGNDRAILSRFDDSVVRVVNGKVQLVRRARGFAPRPIALPAPPASCSSCVLACGPEQKATLALTRPGNLDAEECFVSQHIGDLENAETFDAWKAALDRMTQLFDVRPSVLACDAHAGYLSSQWAQEQARAWDLPLVRVQHHHAHIASVIAEAAVHGEIDPAARVIGIAFDGTGAGATPSPEAPLRKPVLDSTIWGGEILLASLSSYERVTHLEPWRLPGGSTSVRDPRRNAFSLLEQHGLLDHPGASTLLATLSSDERALTSRMLERGINCPSTSSMGRLLDAISAILGICHVATYEGEPAIELEAAAWKHARRCGAVSAQRFDAGTHHDEGDCFTASPQPSHGYTNRPGEHVSTEEATIDVRPLLIKLLDGMAHSAPVEELAWVTHRAIIDITAKTVIGISDATGVRAVALSGGVFMNRLLLDGVSSALEQEGLTVLTPHSLPLNDGCIAYGQAAVAAWVVGA